MVIPRAFAGARNCADEMKASMPVAAVARSNSGKSKLQASCHLIPSKDKPNACAIAVPQFPFSSSLSSALSPFISQQFAEEKKNIQGEKKRPGGLRYKQEEMGRIAAVVFLLTCGVVAAVGFAGAPSCFQLVAAPHSFAARAQGHVAPPYLCGSRPALRARSMSKKSSGVLSLTAGKKKIADLGDVRVAVLGGGSFGLAMASVLGGKGFPVQMLMRKQTAVDYFNKHHMSESYIKGVKLPLSVRATTSVEEALSDATYVIHAVPVQYSRQYLRDIRSVLPENCPIICTSKGIETGSLSLMQDILKEEMGAQREYAFLSGPSFAREIAAGLATAVVVASESDKFANQIAELFGCETFRVFTSRDVVGVEIGGAVKNVIAIAAGMAEGLGLGTNAQAGLVTRGCLEMQTLARSLGASPNTLMGLSGVGDTFGTCFGPLSRNRNLGIRLGQGEEIKDILASSTEVAHILYSVAYILYSEKIKDILASSTEVACILYSVFTAGVSAEEAPPLVPLIYCSFTYLRRDSGYSRQPQRYIVV